MQRSARRHLSRGFTLIELNITLGIVAILSALALPSYRDYVERAHLAELMVQIDAMRTKSQAYAAVAGLDMCRWPNRSPSPPEFVAMEQVVKQGFDAVDPTGTLWPRNMNMVVSGSSDGIGPTIQIAGRGPNAHRTHLLAEELKRAGLVHHMALDRPTFVAMTVYLGPPCS